MSEAKCISFSTKWSKFHWRSNWLNQRTVYFTQNRFCSFYSVFTERTRLYITHMLWSLQWEAVAGMAHASPFSGLFEVQALPMQDSLLSCRASWSPRRLQRQPMFQPGEVLWSSTRTSFSPQTWPQNGHSILNSSSWGIPYSNGPSRTPKQITWFAKMGTHKFHLTSSKAKNPAKIWGSVKQ